MELGLSIFDSVNKNCVIPKAEHKFKWNRRGFIANRAICEKYIYYSSRDRFRNRIRLWHTSMPHQNRTD